jgi:serine/threonine-protein kinase RsbW
VEFRIQNRLSELEGLIAGLTAFCAGAGMIEEAVGDVQVAVDEAVSNTIRHGYADDRTHTIEVRATVERGVLTLEIEDDGKAFNPLDAPPPNVTLPVEEKRLGGLGILLLRKLMDTVEYSPRRGRNVLRLTRSLSSVSR